MLLLLLLAATAAVLLFPPRSRGAGMAVGGCFWPGVPVCCWQALQLGTGAQWASLEHSSGPNCPCLFCRGPSCEVGIWGTPS